MYDELDLVSQNLQGSGDERLPNGTRANIKFEMIVDDMIDEKRDIFAVQETWQTGTWQREIRGVTVFHHGPEEKDWP